MGGGYILCNIIIDTNTITCYNVCVMSETETKNFTIHRYGKLDRSFELSKIGNRIMILAGRGIRVGVITTLGIVDELVDEYQKL